MSGITDLLPLNAIMMSTWTTYTERALVLETCQTVHKFLGLLWQMLIQYVITSGKLLIINKLESHLRKHK
jgi:hypothetical protein